MPGQENAAAPRSRATSPRSNREVWSRWKRAKMASIAPAPATNRTGADRPADTENTAMNRPFLLLIAVLVFVPASVAVSAQEALPDGLADACIETELTDCHVTSAGFMSLENGPQ